MRNVDFGLIIRPTTQDRAASSLLDYNWNAIRSLSSHFSTLWVEDHLQWDNAATLECFTTLSYLAATYPSFRIGTVVLSQAYRNPALVAKMAANIQFLTGGRLVIGVGTGWKEDEYNAYGYPFPDRRTRVEQLEEAIIILRSMWTVESASFKGQYHHIDGAFCEPRPLIPIPLLIGGGGSAIHSS
jgi:alkanesulfonate monooxygenase SsuD/methylene tetrahydromethanopterin reductase-like flavin-dependent oxidoreductase (luciferase family)